MSFLRKHWSGHGTLQSDRKINTTGDATTENLEMPNVTATDPRKMEKPPEKNKPEERKSSPKVQVQPTRPGIKVSTIGQYGRPGSNTVTSTREENKPGVRREVEHPPGYNGTVVSEKRTEIWNKRSNWNTAESGSEGNRSSESMFQSTLFIRQNERETFECSANLCEPNLPIERHMIHSRRSVEINKKCKEVSRRPINYRAADGRKGEIMQTSKSISEPTWNEREKILQQQQLQDNINNLLEQFMYLEAEDIIDLALSQGKLMEYKKKKNHLQINQKSSSQGLRELSREVSPQVLVNIKPFKEQVSDDLLTVERSSAEPKLSKKYNRVERSEERHIRSIPKNRSSLWKSEGTSSEVKSVGGTPRTNINFQLQSATIINKKSGSEEPYLRPNSGTTPKTPTCTVWGVYKSYSACKTAVEVKERKKEKKQTQTEDRGKVRLIVKSFDEVLDVDDSDHDVVFQKNISQFRKKITPEFELDENCHPIYPPKTKLKRFVTSERTKEGKIERFRLEDLEQWKSERKPGRILENVCLVLSEARLLSRIFATRIEAGAIGRPQKAREIRHMMESSGSTVVEMEMLSSFEGDLETLGKESEKLSPLVVRNQGSVIGAFTVHGISPGSMHEFGEPKTKLSEILKACPNSAKCCHVFPERWFFELLRKHESCRNGVNVDGMSSKTRLKGKEKEESEKDVSRRKKKELLLYEPFLKPPCGVVEILNGSPYRYGMITSEPERPSASVSTLWNPQTSEENAGEKTSESSSRAFVGEASAATDRETANSAEALAWATENPSESDSCFDGFQIIYNNSKESIIDDEDDPTKPVFLGDLNERKRSCIIRPEESPSSTANKKTNTVRGDWSEKRTTKSPDGKESRALKFKSNSSPRETVPKLDFVRLGAHRQGRSLILSKEAEKDCLDFRKKKPGIDKELEVGRSPSVEKDFANADSLPFEKSETGSESEDRCVDRRKTFLVENEASSYRKEIVSAFNSIKELSSTKGEMTGGNRRMSLVIMLSKK